MEAYTRDDLSRALREAGLGAGDGIFFQSRLYSFGRLQGVRDKEELCRIFLEAMLDVVGPSGTVVVPAFTTQVARHDVPFRVEETLSNYGLFPEFACRHPDFRRSLHPIHSVAAVGRLKECVCRAGGTSNFGARSPLDVMVKAGFKNVFCGLSIKEAATIAHYAEAHYGVPYVYNKVLKWRPVEKDVPADRPYLATVRYLDYRAAADHSLYEQDLFAKGFVRTARLGGSSIHAVQLTDMVETAYDGLSRDPYYFLAEPPDFDYGIKPYDGPSLAGETPEAPIDGAAGFEMALDKARPTAPRLAALLRDLGAVVPYERQSVLWRIVEGRRLAWLSEGERLAGVLLAAAAGRGLSPRDLFLGLLTGDPAAPLSSPEPERSLLALLLDDTRWRLLRFGRSEFFAPHCLKSAAHVDLTASHGWFARLALEFGVERIVVCAPSLRVSDHCATLLSGWEQRLAPMLCSGAATGGIPLAEGSVQSLVAADGLESVRDPAGLLVEIRRVLRPGGAAYVSGAGLRWPASTILAAAAASGLRVERHVWIGPTGGFGGVLRR